MAENLFKMGLIDGVMEPGALAELVGRALDILMPCRAAAWPEAPATLSVRPAEVDAWTSIEISRQPGRPTSASSSNTVPPTRCR